MRRLYSVIMYTGCVTRFESSNRELLVTKITRNEYFNILTFHRERNYFTCKEDIENSIIGNVIRDF